MSVRYGVIVLYMLNTRYVCFICLFTQYKGLNFDFGGIQISQSSGFVGTSGNTGSNSIFDENREIMDIGGGNNNDIDPMSSGNGEL